MLTILATPNQACREANLLRELAEEIAMALQSAENPDPDFKKGLEEGMIICRKAYADAYLQGSPIDVAICQLVAKINSASRDPFSSIEYEDGLKEVFNQVNTLDRGTSLKPKSRAL